MSFTRPCRSTRESIVPRRTFLIAACALTMTVIGCGSSEQAAVPANDAGASATSPSGGTANTPEGGSTHAGDSAVDMSKPVTVVMETSKGTIELELFPDKSPITVENFVGYVKKGHFDGTIFHRVIADFMIQGGGMTADMQEKPTGEGIKNESENGLKNDRGTIAMARTGDPNSATAQFFINVKDNEALNYPNAGGYGYAVFGNVTKGMDVVDTIRAVPTTSKNGHDDVPVDAVTIKSVKIKETPHAKG